MAACKAGNANVTAALLAKGADPDALDKWNTHASHFAAKGGPNCCRDQYNFIIINNIDKIPCNYNNM